MKTSAEVRAAIFRVRPEWKAMKRIKVELGYQITLNLKDLSDDEFKLFIVHGGLGVNQEAIEKELGVLTYGVQNILGSPIQRMELRVNNNSVNDID